MGNLNLFPKVKKKNSASNGSKKTLVDGCGWFKDLERVLLMGAGEGGGNY